MIEEESKMRDSKEDPNAVALSDGPVHNPDSARIRKEREHRSDIRQLLSHTLSRKNLMALTGFFQLISYVLFASILVHAVYALLITIQNKRSNGRRYECDRRSVSSKWYSRRMGLLGTIILFFLVIHLRDFWYQLQFGHVPRDKDGQKDLYTLVVSVYQNGWYVLIYVLGTVALGYHLLHGFFSAARTLGFYNARYVYWVRVVGWVYSIGIAAGFALIPVYIHFTRP
jgi:succinate dehydrogenase / fumarate reductase cytochrome b subunit